MRGFLSLIKLFFAPFHLNLKHWKLRFKNQNGLTNNDVEDEDAQLLKKINRKEFKKNRDRKKSIH